jgi:pimeloyl-ACP methyl ester carboxylesterase
MNCKNLLLFLLSLLLLPANAQETLGINLEGYDYPYPVKRSTFMSQQQELSMAYQYEKSPQPNGETVLLLHGKNFNGAYWGETMKALLASGYDVIVPDQIGFGKSTKPGHYQYTFQQLAENTRALLEKEGIGKSVVLGHSMGGMLATRYALMYPQHTEQLILVNPIGLEDWKLKVPYVDIDTWYKQELKKTAAGIKKYQLESYYFGEWDKKYDAWVYLLAAPLESPDYPRLAWNAALTYDMIFTQPVVYEFSELKVPTVLMIGQRDRTALGKNLVSNEVASTMGDYPALGKKVAEQIPGARLIEFEGLGHLPHIQDFERFRVALFEVLSSKR